MKFKRSSGILMHPTSFSGTPGIGTLGQAAFDFVDWLEEAHQTLWQILPIGPTGYGDSPYASFKIAKLFFVKTDVIKEKGHFVD